MATTPLNGRVALSSLELEPVEPDPLLTVVVPTKNERGNVPHVVARLDAALPTVPLEIVFVDDSDDGTAELVEDLAAESGRPRWCSCSSRPSGTSGAWEWRSCRCSAGPGSMGLRDGR